MRPINLADVWVQYREELMRRKDGAMAVLEADVVPFALPNRIECERERISCLLRNSSKIALLRSGSMAGFALQMGATRATAS